jgi:hypothetical protein
MTVSTISKIYTGVFARRLNDWAERKGAVSVSDVI